VSAGEQARSLSTVLMFSLHQKFFYDHHLLASSGSCMVRLIGSDVASYPGSLRVSTGDSASERSFWVSDSALMNRVSSGWGQMLQVSVSSDLQVRQFNLLSSYRHVQGFSFQMNIPASGSVHVSVVGSSFPFQSSASAYIGLSRCLSTTWKSSSSMHCRSGSGLGAGWPLYFSLEVLSTLALMSFDRIRLESMVYFDPFVLVNGSGFGREVAKQSERSLSTSTVVPAHHSVTAASVSLENRKSEFQLDSVTASVAFDGVSRLDDVKIFLTPPILVSASSLLLFSNNCYGCLSNASSFIQFMFSDDAASQVPAFGCYSGVFKPKDSLRLKDFLLSVAAYGRWALLITAGSSDLRIQSASIEFMMSSLKVSVGSTPVSSLVWSSDTSISISVAPGYGHALNLSATSAMQLSSNVLQYSYLNPVVDAAYPALLATTASFGVLLVGSRFQVIDFSPRLRFGTACAASIWTSDSVVACRIGSSRKTEASALISLGLIIGSSAALVTGLFEPVTLTVFPKSTQLTGGIIVDIWGKAFGVHGISSQVSLAGSPGAASVWHSDSQLVSKVMLPARVPTSLVVSVFQTVSRTEWKNSSFVLDLSSSALNIPASGSYNTMINGINIGSHSSTLSAKFTSTAAERLAWISSSATLCKLPSGSRSSTSPGIGILLSLSRQVGIDLVQHTHPVASSVLFSANQTLTLPVGLVGGSGFGGNDPSLGVAITTISSLKTLWYSDSSITIGIDANKISTDLFMLDVAFSDPSHGLVSTNQVPSPVFIPKPIPLTQVLSAKLYVPISLEVLNRADVLTDRGMAASGDLPSPSNYMLPDDVGFMEQVNVSAIIYNNGSQVFVKDSVPVSKSIIGEFSTVDAQNFRVVNISCGGAKAVFNATMAANTYAVLIQPELVFCSASFMRVLIVVSFSILGEYIFVALHLQY
jgi:hypothetical protein